MIDLSPENKTIVEEILRRRIPGMEVWVFGSRAGGKTKPHSDLDLAVVSEGPVLAEVWDQIDEDFKDSDLPIRVDVLDLARISEDFRTIIVSNHEVLVASAATAREA